MERKRVGRPRQNEGEVKQSSIAVRTTSSLHSALKKAAEENGRSITQEVEARIAASFQRDAGRRSVETENLLSQIALEITKIEEMTGCRWHKHRKTAGAVLEMLSDFPASIIRVDAPTDDELVNEAFDAWFDLCAQRKDRLDKLAELGVPADAEGQTWLDDYMEGGRNKRWRERRVVETLRLPPAIQEVANRLLDEVETLDSQIARAKAALQEAAQPYDEAEKQGRELYRKERHRQSLLSFARLQAMVRSVDVELPKEH